MRKVKFKIKGMDFKSSAVLLEEKLQSREGIIKARVNFESGKAVVVYDDQRINESEIEAIITKTGEYNLEKLVEEAVEPEQPASPFQPERQPRQAVQVFAPAPKNQFLLGFLISFSIFSLILNIILASSLFKSVQAKAGDNNQNTAAQLPTVNSGANPSPSPAPIVAGTTIQNFDITKTNHVRGDFNAPVTLVEFSDFECPFCERHFPTLTKILNDYQGKVRLVYKHFPLSIHPNSQKAAEASECADEQGKFWEYHDKLFTGQPAGFSLDKFKQWAKDIGLNADQFNNCLDTGKYTQKVQTDEQEGQQKGVQGTPATFVNGQLVSGALPYDSFKQVIDQALSK